MKTYPGYPEYIIVSFPKCGTKTINKGEISREISADLKSNYILVIYKIYLLYIYIYISFN